ncbi:hypothetical protein EDEG_00888 [Edhazardia aedis USNM 41457]|uniref:Guanylate kinase-like domain-containing protein n=1 Tax=Edhazardia aedis (strain USNM 41457) TaxID=1003232 RepID=J8ZZA5_EDHAE|nr:hypothetical protein EDEG_00888 [Edhazardia aedis USNM 41457]|eukprot:EJW05008.1 hypothetical protein EDEG_00888 [Edhazardia aedis USNM 41457]
MIKNKTTRPNIVFSGPSGSGKSTILRRLVSESNTQSIFVFSVSHTTRKIRENEKDGYDYHFVSRDIFEEMIKNDEFLEYATYNDNYYGTSKKEALKLERCNLNEINVENQNDNNKPILVLDLERKGVLALKKMNSNFKYIFIYADKNEIKERLLNRLKKDCLTLIDLKEIENRLNEYDNDVECFNSGIYDFSVKNVSVEQAVCDIIGYLNDINN